MADVDIANLALSHLGAQRIAALSDTSKNAIACRLHYDTVRDSLLRARLWKFAIVPVKLSKLADAPIFGWSNAFVLPHDFLRVATFNGFEVDLRASEFRIEGLTLLTDADEAQITYVQRGVAADRFDSNFVEVLAYRLAAAIAMEITQSADLRNMMEGMAAEKQKKAGHVNAAQGRSTVISGPSDAAFGRHY